jgi:hypothetical protein
VVFGAEEFHVKPLTDNEFRQNRCTGHRTLLAGVSEILLLPATMSFLLTIIRYRVYLLKFIVLVLSLVKVGAVDAFLHSKA